MSSSLPSGFSRVFSVEIETIATVWSTSAMSTDRWTPTGKKWHTNSQPFEVINQNNFRGVAKPGQIINDRCLRAAHEKIASDLAYILRLPIPPVTLWDRGDGHNGERHCAISAFAFPQPLEWHVQRAMRTPQQIATASRAAGAMKAFDTWIAASDRKSDHVLVHDSTTDSGVAHIDYAFAMSHEWGIGPSGPMADPRPGFPNDVPTDAAATEAIAQAIENIKESELSEIINRIPAGYFLDGARDIILSTLLRRRDAIRSLLNIPARKEP